VTSKTAKINAIRRKFGLPEYSEERANALPHFGGPHYMRIVFAENIPELIASAESGVTRDHSCARRVFKTLNGLKSGHEACPLCMTAFTPEIDVGAIMIIVRAVDEDDIAHENWEEFHHAVFCRACAGRSDFEEIIKQQLGELPNIPLSGGHA
jgi:hypothetical protein